ncbi:MAG: glycosyltransferase family 39 protein, partial [Solirubrobacterales bacterium]
MEPDETTNTTRARWFLWSVLALTALAAALRFSTLGLQSYRHDEAVTAGRVLVASFTGTMHLVWTSESTPPLYYAFAWLWSHLFGVHEVGLRSLSALFGTATVPVSYLAGRELIGRRTGLVVAAIVAVNPLLVWYSQDARAYALLVLLSAAAFLFFLRARRTGRPRDLAWW